MRSRTDSFYSIAFQQMISAVTHKSCLSWQIKTVTCYHYRSIANSIFIIPWVVPSKIVDVRDLSFVRFRLHTHKPQYDPFGSRNSNIKTYCSLNKHLFATRVTYLILLTVISSGSLWLSYAMSRVQSCQNCKLEVLTHFRHITEPGPDSATSHWSRWRGRVQCCRSSGFKNR